MQNPSLKSHGRESTRPLLGIRRAALATTALIPTALMAQIAFADPVA
ncbi:hypothetical protein [Cereibacter johrii]|nr:hypothetical protein [Cereibacter johrii]